MSIADIFSFKGRATRTSYWLTVAAVVVVTGVMRGVTMAAGDPVALQLISRVVALVTFVIALANGAKRWHDRDKSAWWLLIGLIPLVGQIWTLVELGFLPGTPTSNRFGPPAASMPGVSAPQSPTFPATGR